MPLRPWTWPWLLATTLARAVLATVICLGLWGALPAAWGWLPTTVSSGSMLPRLHVGDVAVSRPMGPTLPPLASVLLFDDPDHPGRLRLHRFVRLEDDGRLVTRGDANGGDDSSPVSLDAVRGIGTLRVPWVGLPVVWLRERAWFPLGLGLLGLAALTAVAAQSRRFGFPETEGNGTDDAPPGPAGIDAEPAGDPAPSGSGPGVSRAVGALGMALLLGLVPAGSADAAFAARTTSTARLTATPYFTCAAAVTASAPTAWFRMDETSATTTTAADSASSGRPGVYGSAGKTPVTTQACRRDTGRAMTFDGTSGYLSSGQITSGVTTFTLGVWFRTTTTRGGKLIGWGNVPTGPSGVFDRHLYLTNAGRLVFGVYTGGAKTVSSSAVANDGAWHHAVATLSSAGMRLYLDGALVGSDAAVTTAEPTSSGYLRMAYDNLDGWPNAPTSRYFAGTLDDAVLYPTALTEAQIAAQHDAGT